MDYEILIKEFSDLVRNYCDWVEGEDKGQSSTYELQILLSKLYSWGMQLPDCDPTERFGNEEPKIPSNEKTMQYFSGFPYQYYSTIYNANITPSEEPVTGDIIDDLADIYRDLKEGLWYFDQGSEVDAVFHWRFTLGVHWARHIMGAMYALYCFEA